MDVHVQRRDLVPGVTRRALLAVVLLVLAAGYGGFRAITLLSSPVRGPETLRVGGVQVQLLAAEEVVGIAGSDLMGGMAHNISGYVSADQMTVQVSLRLSAGGHVADYDPRALRAYAVGSHQAIQPASSTLGAGTLTPHSFVEGSISFLVPRGSKHLVLGTGDGRHTIDIPVVPAAAGSTTPPEPGGNEHHASSDHGGQP